MPQPAIFLDRDGTLIEDRGYLHDPDTVHFFPDTIAALQSLHPFFRLFMVTNQAGIGDGVIAYQDAVRINRFVENRLASVGILISASYICPHARGTMCQCRKPNPFFALSAAREFDLDLPRSVAIGDHPHDVEFGRNFGGSGVYVLTGHGSRHRTELPAGWAAPVVTGMAAAAELLLVARMASTENCDDAV